jgi:hypothetical protein
MDGRDLFDLRATLQRQGIIFAFSGYMTETVLSGVGEAIKQKLTIDDADTKTLRSVFAVFVEQMQNIIRYSAEKAQPRSLPLPTRPHLERSATASSRLARRTANTSSVPAIWWRAPMSGGSGRDSSRSGT